MESSYQMSATNYVYIRGEYIFTTRGTDIDMAKLYIKLCTSETDRMGNTTYSSKQNRTIRLKDIIEIRKEFPIVFTTDTDSTNERKSFDKYSFNEEFLSTHSDKWDVLKSFRGELSTEFMTKYRDRIDMRSVIYLQPIPRSFFIFFFDKIKELDIRVRVYNIDIDFYNKYRDYISLCYILYFGKDVGIINYVLNDIVIDRDILDFIFTYKCDIAINIVSGIEETYKYLYLVKDETGILPLICYKTSGNNKETYKRFYLPPFSLSSTEILHFYRNRDKFKEFVKEKCPLLL